MNKLEIDAKELIKALTHCTDGKHTSCEGCPYYSTKYACASRSHSLIIIQFLLNEIEKQEWKDASKRPPKEGRYLVWGLHMFTPDHCDEPNAYWQTRIANWSNRWGWDTRVKYWRELPELPMDDTH